MVGYRNFEKKRMVGSLTSSNGTVRSCSAEQLLSHILPVLAGIKGEHFTVRVESDYIVKI